MKKPGQFIWIHGKQYRVKRSKEELGCLACNFDLRDSNEEPCATCISVVDTEIANDCYLESVHHGQRK